MVSLLIYCCLLILAQTQKYSPLQVLDYPVSITYSDDDYKFEEKNDGNYQITLNIPYESLEVPQIIYCFKRLKTEKLEDGQNCELIQDQSEFRCIQANYTTDYKVQSQTTPKITTSWRQFNFSTSKGVTPTGNPSKRIFVPIQPTNLTRTIVLGYWYFSQFVVYQMITARSIQMLKSYEEKQTQAKFNYFHTYTFYEFYETLVSQRNYHCILYDNKIIYIFQGAVSRGGEPHLFTSILTTATQNISFYMWGGYSYSSGHAARDMVGYESHTQNFYDMYSLYASAPFEDVASNINGKKNVMRISNSGPSAIKSEGFEPFYFVQFYRLFDTLDINGDEIIRDKINNPFCFAAYFQNVTNSKTESELSVLSRSFKHQLIDCHIPVLKIFQHNLARTWLLLLMALFFLLH